MTPITFLFRMCATSASVPVEIKAGAVSGIAFAERRDGTAIVEAVAALVVDNRKR
jgi:hypothetical protein